MAGFVNLLHVLLVLVPGWVLCVCVTESVEGTSLALEGVDIYGSDSLSLGMFCVGDSITDGGLCKLAARVACTCPGVGRVWCGSGLS